MTTSATTTVVTTTVVHTTTGGSITCPTTVGLCDCLLTTGCGFCKSNSTTSDAHTCLPKTSSTGSGEAICHEKGMVWVPFSEQCKPMTTSGGTTVTNTKTGEPTKTTVTSTRTGEPTKTTTAVLEPRPCSYTSLCDCVKDVLCGYCKWATAQKCNKREGATTTGLSGEAWCKNEKGNWTTSTETCVEHQQDYKAEIKGVVEGVVDTNLTDTIAKVIQGIIASKLKIDPSTVEVTVSIKTEADVTSFSVTVKVGSGTISLDQFSDINNISAAELEAQLSGAGVTLKEGTVSVQQSATNTSNAGKIIVSVFLVALAFFF